jgi:hypothetical protein
MGFLEEREERGRNEGTSERVMREREESKVCGESRKKTKRK